MQLVQYLLMLWFKIIYCNNSNPEERKGKAEINEEKNMIKKEFTK